MFTKNVYALSVDSQSILILESKEFLVGLNRSKIILLTSNNYLIFKINKRKNTLIILSSIHIDYTPSSNCNSM